MPRNVNTDLDVSMPIRLYWVTDGSGLGGASPLPEAYVVRYGGIEIGKRGGIQARDTVLKTPLVAD
jgi:hypothetical protein